MCEELGNVSVCKCVFDFCSQSCSVKKQKAVLVLEPNKGVYLKNLKLCDLG